ncbi:MAG: metallophosphoesterase [Lentisphaeria bacterium]|nr:metallophosphoesterase [Lentisphaeria bacterium]
MKKLFLLLSLVGLALGAGEFRVAATADIHGNLRNLAALAPAIRREKPDILVDAGDLIGGDAFSEHDGGRSMIDALNLLHCAFRVPGNHDFETTPGDFHELCRRFRGVTLGGDWRWGDVSGVPWRIVTKGKFRCAVVGLTEPGIRRRHLPGKGPRFTDWTAVLRKNLAEIRRRQVSFIVLVWHNGLEARPDGIAHVIRNFPEIDAVVAAHSHRANPGSREGNCYVVQPGAYALSGALLGITYDDRDGKARSIRSRLLSPDPENPDPELSRLARRSSAYWFELGKKRVCAPGELALGRFPALAAEALARAGGTPGAVFVCRTPGNGNVPPDSLAALHRLLPFRNVLCTVELDRNELRELMEELSRNAARFKRRVAVRGFSWQPGSRKRPAIFRAPMRIRLTLTDYMLLSSAVLRRVLEARPDCLRRLEITERDAVAAFLSSRL